MKSLKTLILIISIVIASNQGFSNGDSPYSVDMTTVMYNSATTIKYNAMEDEESSKITQCTYDYKGLRMNDGCFAESEEPLICLRGELILKTFDDGRQMCCCNYSKLDKE